MTELHARERRTAQPIVVVGGGGGGLVAALSLHADAFMWTCTSWPRRRARWASVSSTTLKLLPK